MTEYHAKIERLTLCVFIPYPPELRRRHDEIVDDVIASTAHLPEWARVVGRPVLSFNPDISAWIDGLDFGPIRAEFIRKANKMSLSGASDTMPVNIWHGANGVRLTADLTSK